MQQGMQYLWHVFSFNYPLHLSPVPFPLWLCSIYSEKTAKFMRMQKTQKFVNNWNFHSSRRKQRTLSVFSPLLLPLYFSTSTPLSPSVSASLTWQSELAATRVEQEKLAAVNHTTNTAKIKEASWEAHWKGVSERGGVKRGKWQVRGGGCCLSTAAGLTSGRAGLDGLRTPAKCSSITHSAQTNCSCRRLEGKRREGARQQGGVAAAGRGEAEGD